MKNSNAGGGGLIKDINEVWKAGFSANIGTCFVVEAELCAVLYGLQIAWQDGDRKVHLESDCSTVVGWLRDDVEIRCSHANLLIRCKENHGSGLHAFPAAPDCVKKIFDDDCNLQRDKFSEEDR